MSKLCNVTIKYADNTLLRVFVRHYVEHSDVFFIKMERIIKHICRPTSIYKQEYYLNHSNKLYENKCPKLHYNNRLLWLFRSFAPHVVM